MRERGAVRSAFRGIRRALARTGGPPRLKNALIERALSETQGDGMEYEAKIDIYGGAFRLAKGQRCVNPPQWIVDRLSPQFLVPVGAVEDPEKEPEAAAPADPEEIPGAPPETTEEEEPTEGGDPDGPRAASEVTKPKKKRGRPKGSKNKPKSGA